MITHERLVEDVAARTRLATGEAGHVLRVALAVLAHRLPAPQRRRLRQAVPGPERDAAMAVVPPATGGRSELLEEIARNLQTTVERALFLARAALSPLAEADPGLTRELRGVLPREFGVLFEAPDPYPERRHAGVDAPAALTEEELDAELSRRPQWSGDAHHLTRVVALPDDRLPPLLSQLDRDAEDLNHRYEHHRVADGVSFTVHTRSIDAVTRLDLDLADRIDAAVVAVGSGGRPGPG